MMIPSATQCVVMAITAVVSAPQADMETQAAQRIVEQVNGLPRYGVNAIRPTDRQPLQDAARLPSETALQLCRSESARDRGVGLWALYAGGDHQALFELPHLLEDDEPTLPYGAPMAGVGQYVYTNQTVGEYLSSIYSAILGAPVGGAADFEAKYGEIRSVERLIQPWVARLARAADDAKRSVAIKADVRQLPESQRWLVIQRSAWWHPPGYTPEEAAAEFALLSADTKRKIMDGTIEPPVDPLYRKRVDGRAVNEWRDGAPPKWLLERARSYLTGAPPAAPAPEEKPAAEPPAEAPPE